MHLVFDFVVFVVSNTFGSVAGLGAVPGAASSAGSNIRVLSEFSVQKYFVFKVIKNFLACINKSDHIS